MATTFKRTDGRKQKSASRSAALRQPNLSRFYGREMSDVRPGEFVFRLRLLRGRGSSILDLSPVVESFSWEDSEATLTGSLSVRRPDPADAGSLPIGIGHRVLCEVQRKGGWYKLWQMRVQPFETDGGEGAIEVPLTDDLALLSRNRRDWSFRKTKARKRGWLPQEIVRAVARTEHIPIGVLTPGKYRQTSLVKKNTDALTIIRAAYGHEREKSGRRFVIRLRDGKLEVIALQRNEILYVFRDQIVGAITRQEQAERPVTVIEGTGRIGRKKPRKVKYTLARRDVIARFGRVVEGKSYGTVASMAELRQKVQRDYAKKTRVKRTATLTVPGVPFIRRGDGIQWKTTEAGWHGGTTELRDRSFVYVLSVSHDVSGSGYTTTMELVQEDPYFKDSERLDKELREKARKKKKAKK